MRNVDYWAKIGLATSTVPARGTGTERRYSYEDLIVLASLAEISSETNVSARRIISGALRLADLHKQDILEVRISSLLVFFISLERIRQRIKQALTQPDFSGARASADARRRQTNKGVSR